MLFVDMPRGIDTVDLAHRSYCWAVNALTMADFNAAAVAMSAHVLARQLVVDHRDHVAGRTGGQGVGELPCPPHRLLHAAKDIPIAAAVALNGTPDARILATSASRSRCVCGSTRRRAVGSSPFSLNPIVLQSLSWPANAMMGEYSRVFYRVFSPDQRV
jgi:hypothetical protein